MDIIFSCGLKLLYYHYLPPVSVGLLMLLCVPAFGRTFHRFRRFHRPRRLCRLCRTLCFLPILLILLNLNVTCFPQLNAIIFLRISLAKA